MSQWSQKIVVVTGSSKGLGFEIAKAFCKHGAETILLARSEPDLASATKQLQDAGHQAHFRVMDACDNESVESVFSEISRQFGRIDVLVNNIGKSTRANILELDLQESIDLMDLNYFTALRCTRASLNSLVQSQGHVVNIGSLASKTAWPFMTPYSASKFALAAFTHQLRIELGDKIHAMLVCPGPIRRKDSGTRYDEVADQLPENAKTPGAGAKLKGLDPEWLAERIVTGCEKRKAELIIPWKAKLLFVAASVSTRLGDWLLRKNSRGK